jgi:hypothetical protein
LAFRADQLGEGEIAGPPGDGEVATWPGDGGPVSGDNGDGDRVGGGDWGGDGEGVSGGDWDGDGDGNWDGDDGDGCCVVDAGGIGPGWWLAAASANGVPTDSTATAAAMLSAVRATRRRRSRVYAPGTRSAGTASPARSASESRMRSSKDVVTAGPP